MLSNFNKGPMRTTLTHHGCYQGVIKACYETCEEPLAFVSYAQAEDSFVIMSYVVHPCATEKEAHLAGDLIDSALELEALKLGVKQLLLVPTGSSTAEFVRDYKVEPFVMAFGYKTNPVAHIN